jgi:hypothetical protein
MIKYDFKTYPWVVAQGSFPINRGVTEKMNFLLRYAILAPSSHNTQPWKFSVEENLISAYVNKDRWLKVADADRREMYISVGCALENLLVAADHFGYDHEIAYFPEPGNEKLIARVSLVEAEDWNSLSYPDPFDAITARHTNHKQYNPQSITPEALRPIQDCCTEEGVSLRLIDDRELRREFDQLVIRADAIEFANPEFRDELGYWIGEGAFGMPWLLEKMSQLALSYLDLGGWAAKKDSDVLMSAPVLGLLSSRADDRESQVKVGRVFERIYLKATLMGISIQPMSQVLQVAEVKREVASLISEVNLFPQQPFRLGYSEPEKEHTPRRPIEEALL